MTLTPWSAEVQHDRRGWWSLPRIHISRRWPKLPRNLGMKTRWSALEALCFWRRVHVFSMGSPVCPLRSAAHRRGRGGKHKSRPIRCWDPLLSQCQWQDCSVRHCAQIWFGRDPSSHFSSLSLFNLLRVWYTYLAVIQLAFRRSSAEERRHPSQQCIESNVTSAGPKWVKPEQG
jgi:hypothetical protein